MKRLPLIITAVSLPVWIILGYLLYDSLSSQIAYNEAIKLSEKKAAQKLTVIRELEKAYMVTYNTYTANWDSLKLFAREGEMYEIQSRDSLVKKDVIAGNTYVQIKDTLGKHKVMEFLFPKEKFPYVNDEFIASLEKTPNPAKADSTLQINVDYIPSGPNRHIHVIQVVDIFPVDTLRNDENERADMKLLKFGSLYDTNLAGNWE